MNGNIVGKTVAGCQILELIGKGGMGVVYHARHLELDQDRAVKIMDQRLAADQAFMKRFRTEAKALAKLRSHYIVTVYDFAETEFGLCLVMEYVKGRTLGEIIKATGPLEPQRIFHLFKQILRAFEHAHSVGVIHRDIKPGNILVTSSDEVKVADFGLAKIQQQASGATVTQLGGGTLYYGSPEQIEGAKLIDARSDLYSIGMTVYEALTGAVPFDPTTSEFKVSEKIVKGEIPPPRALRPQVLKPLNDFVVKAIARNPERRYQTAAGMRSELERIEEEFKKGPPSPPPKGRRLSVPLVGAAIFIAAVLGYTIFRLGSSGPSTPQGDTTHVRVLKPEVAASLPEVSPRRPDSLQKTTVPKQEVFGSSEQKASAATPRPPSVKPRGVIESPAPARLQKFSVFLHDKAGNPVPNFKLRINGQGGKEYEVPIGPDGKASLRYDVDGAGLSPMAVLTATQSDGKTYASAQKKLVIVPSRGKIDIDINTFLPDWDKNLDDQMARARAFAAKEDWEEARGALKEVLDRRPGQGSAEAWILLAQSWFEDKKKYYPKALEALDHALILRQSMKGPGYLTLVEKMYYYLVVAGYEQYDDLKSDDPKRKESKQRVLDYCNQHGTFWKDGTFKQLDYVQYEKHTRRVEAVRKDLQD